MEIEKISGQYGKRNPLFMYQRTAGYGLRAALGIRAQAEQGAQGAQVYTAVPPQSGEQRCGAMMQ